MTPVRGIPTSKAYWELRAEQVLNRVFSPEAAIEVEICDTPATADEISRPATAVATSAVATSAVPATAVAPSPAPAPGSPPRQKPLPRRPAAAPSARHQPTLVLASVSLTVTVMAGIGLMALGVWNQSQQAIRQERNMLLIERLRSMGPATAEASAAVQPQPDLAATAEDPSLPPPPPAEPWMEELATLPASGAPAANVLKVPMSSRVGSPAPAASGSSRSYSGSSSPAGASGSGGGGGPAPQLVGVVQAPGHGGAAIFQIGNSSTSAAVGESIGSSGWRLRSASGDAAVIERGGEQRRVSISSGS
ncbi:MULTISPECIES: hypothetical protein [Aphanothece]|uniref:hypothetical protein n=1 Tax=Aphanothece TaxID=1121 RepID=UPI003984C9D6